MELPQGVELDPLPRQVSATMLGALAALTTPEKRERTEVPRVEAHVVRVRRRRKG